MEAGHRGDGHSQTHSHSNGPGPGHPQGPGLGPEENLGPSGEASVVLDIGPHAGALVLYTEAELAGAEIEIRPGGGAWTGTHTAVRASVTPAAPCAVRRGVRISRRGQLRPAAQRWRSGALSD